MTINLVKGTLDALTQASVDNNVRLWRAGWHFVVYINLSAMRGTRGGLTLLVNIYANLTEAERVDFADWFEKQFTDLECHENRDSTADLQCPALARD